MTDTSARTEDNRNPRRSVPDAGDLLRRLVGEDVSTVTGAVNRVIDVRPPDVIVATDRSPQGSRYRSLWFSRPSQDPAARQKPIQTSAYFIKVFTSVPDDKTATAFLRRPGKQSIHVRVAHIELIGQGKQKPVAELRQVADLGCSCDRLGAGCCSQSASTCGPATVHYRRLRTASDHALPGDLH